MLRTRNNSIQSAMTATSPSAAGSIDSAKILDSVQGNTTEAALVHAIVVNAYHRGFRVIFLIGAGLAAAAFLVAFFLMPQYELDRPDDQRLKAEGRRADDEARAGGLHSSSEGPLEVKV